MPVLPFAVMRKSSAARAAHREALALGSSAPLRSSAARAALREAPALRSLAPLRSSAARAAHRGQARSYICCNVPFQSGHGCQPWRRAEDRRSAGRASRNIASC